MIEQGDGEDRQDLIERVTKRLADYLGITASDWSYRELAEEVIAEIEWQHVIVPEAEWRDVGELAMTLARWSDVAHDYGWWERNERNSGGRAMTGRDESLIMCDHCKLGFPGGEITNIGTPDEPEWLCVGCYRERRELVTAGRPTIDRGWKTRQVTGAMVSVAAPDRAGATKGQKQDG